MKCIKRKDYIKGLKKAKEIILKYYYRTEITWIKAELIKEISELIKYEEKK